MKRLIETQAELQAGEHRLAELLRGAESFQPNPFRKRLVLQRVTRQAMKASLSSWPAVLSPKLASLVGAATVAAAAVGWYATREAPVEAAKTEPVLPVLPAPPKPVSETKAPTLTPDPEPLVAPEPARERPPREVRSQRESRARTGEDPTQVIEAVRALRKRGDAARAQVLLDRYLTTHPGGALTEDALALAIEAAAARHDPRAADYARRYLARFPNGRFRRVALKAAGRESE